jgi:hypothetical protein
VREGVKGVIPLTGEKKGGAEWNEKGLERKEQKERERIRKRRSCRLSNLPTVGVIE